MNDRINQPGFRPRNTLKDEREDPPEGPPTQKNTPATSKQLSEVFTPNSLPHLSTPQDQSTNWERTQYSFGTIGSSSSLFSFESPASFDFSHAPKDTNTQPTSSLFKFLDTQQKDNKSEPFSYPTLSTSLDFAHATGHNTKHKQKKSETFTFSAPPTKMVNERVPAKSSQPIVIDDSPLAAGGPNTSKRRQPAPGMEGHVFGQASPMKPAANMRRPVDTADPFYRPKQRVEHHRSNHPHMHAMKEGAKKVLHPFHQPVAPSAYESPRFSAPSGPGVPIPIRRPGDSEPIFVDSRPVPQQTFGSLEKKSNGFPPVNGYQKKNFVDLTTNNYRDKLAPPPAQTFVDPTKAAADLKALLEGAIEDEDDKPRTRSRKKKQTPTGDGALSAMLKGMAITKDQEEKEEEEEEEEDDGTVEGIKVKLLPHQIEGLEWMKERELGARIKKGSKVPKGGILADDMGLGKTLQSISLILSNSRPKDKTEEAIKRKIPTGVSKCTLVVAPLALIRQWELEIKEKVEDSHRLSVYVHHGPSRTKRFQDLLKYDVVVTTYQILVSEMGNSSDKDDGLKVGCFGISWYRVILDEAHTIKNRNAKATKACYSLRSVYRWCLTGTPMQNNLDELQSLIQFLDIAPYNDLKVWKDQIDRPMKNGRGDLSINRLQNVLKIFMKRRTKEILKKDGALNPGGKPSAPGAASTTGFKVTERKVENVSAEFSAEERRFYDRLEQRTDQSLEQMMGGEKVNYASALVLLLRLRQACNHPQLVAGKLGKDSEAFGGEMGVPTPRKPKATKADVEDDLADMFGGLNVATTKCEICQVELSKKAAADGETHCEECLADLADLPVKKLGKGGHKKSLKNVDSDPEDVKPTSRRARYRPRVLDSEDEEELDADSLDGSKGFNTDEDSDEDDLPANPLDALKSKKRRPRLSIDGSDESADEAEGEFGSSDDENELVTMTSSAKVTRLLTILNKEAAVHKFIVFSQFTSMLDLIEPFLNRDGLKFTRYDGSMRNDLREASLGRLRNDPSCRILLCSLKCGSLGLNLTAATRVVILEPFWNPFVEEQAIDRVHRLTQKIDVVIYKITVKDTVEERILALQEKKRELAKQTIEPGAKNNASKLGMQEILGLFRRDAEHGPQSSINISYKQPRILAERSNSGGSGSGSGRESPAPRKRDAERRTTPPVRNRGPSVYDRRW